MTVETMAAAHSETSEFRAGGTDISERRRSGVSRGPVSDLLPAGVPAGIGWRGDGGALLGAGTTIAALASDARLAAAYPGLVAAAAGLATPQIRHMATLGGNIAQHSRCWYYRNPSVRCLKKGGTACPARAGNHLGGVVFDTGPCVMPHASTLAAALLAYDATIATGQRGGLSVGDVLGDGASSAHDHALGAGECILEVALPVPVAGERALYKRAIGRTHAEWPLVELVARAVVEGGKFKLLRFAAGGVAPRPLRLAAAEAAGLDQPCDAGTIARISRAASAGARPLPMTAYKLTLLEGLTTDLLEQLAST